MYWRSLWLGSYRQRRDGVSDQPSFLCLTEQHKKAHIVPGAQRLWQLSALADPDKRPIPSRKWPFVKYEGLY